MPTANKPFIFRNYDYLEYAMSYINHVGKDCRRLAYQKSTRRTESID